MAEAATALLLAPGQPADPATGGLMAEAATALVLAPGQPAGARRRVA